MALSTPTPPHSPQEPAIDRRVGVCLGMAGLLAVVLTGLAVFVMHGMCSTAVRLMICGSPYA
jgi:hypothetical protein